MLHPKATHIILSNGKNGVKADACRISLEYDTKQEGYRQSITSLNRISLGETDARFKNMAFNADFLKQYVTALKKAGVSTAKVSVTDGALLTIETSHPFGTAIYIQAPYLLNKRPMYYGKTVG
jgi:hypothetical protein